MSQVSILLTYRESQLPIQCSTSCNMSDDIESRITAVTRDCIDYRNITVAPVRNNSRKRHDPSEDLSRQWTCPCQRPRHNKYTFHRTPDHSGGHVFVSHLRFVCEAHGWGGRTEGVKGSCAHRVRHRRVYFQSRSSCRNCTSSTFFKYV